MPRTFRCPFCEHSLDTFLRPRESTFCESCGHAVSVPRDAALSDHWPTVEVLQLRARAAGRRMSVYGPVHDWSDAFPEWTSLHEPV